MTGAGRDRPEAAGHPVELILDFVAGALEPSTAAAVRRHLDRCPSCARELEAWRAVAEAARDRAARTRPATDLAERIAERMAADREHARRHPSIARRLRWLAAFVASQLPVVRREIWSASAIVVVIGSAVSLFPDRGSVPGVALALFAPLAAALGIALVYGHDNDPSLEIALATPISPRLVVLARLTLVLAWDLVLALAATVLVVALAGRPDAFLSVVGLWLGPMLLLGCLSLVLSLLVGTSAALAVAGLIWLARAIQLADTATPEPSVLLGEALGAILDLFWQTSPLTLALAAAVLVTAVVVTPSRARLDRAGAA